MSLSHGWMSRQAGTARYEQGRRRVRIHREQIRAADQLADRVAEWNAERERINSRGSAAGTSEREGIQLNILALTHHMLAALEIYEISRRT